MTRCASNPSPVRVVGIALLSLTLSACNVFGGKKTDEKVDPPAAGTPATKPGGKDTAKAPATLPKPIDPTKSPDEQFKDALAALKAKNFDEARAGFDALAKSNPELSGPLSNLGILDAKAGKREAAIADFTRATSANPQNAMAYNWLGLLYRETKAYPDAERAYLRAIETRRDYAQPQLNLGILYEVYLNRPGDALAHYRSYQQLTGGKELKVTAWIKNLEGAGVVPPNDSAPAVVPTSTSASPAKPEKRSWFPFKRSK